MAEYTGINYFEDEVEEVDNEYTGINYFEDEVEDTYVGERGFIGDTASALGRGGLGALNLASNAFEVITGRESGLDEWADKTGKEVDFFKLDESAYLGQSTAISRGWSGAMESMIPSISGALPGAAVGAGVGSVIPVVGTAAGGIVGGILGTLGFFGAGVYGQSKKEGAEQGLAGDDLHSYAFNNALIEGGIESAATGVELLTAGFGKVFTRPLAATLKGMVSTSAKDIGKAYGKTMATEVSTEMLQAGLGAENAKKYGIEAMGTAEAITESILPSMFMSGIFATVGQGTSVKRRSELRRGLESKDPNAVAAVHKELERQDPELASEFKEYSLGILNNPNATFDMDMELVSLFDKVKESEVTRATKTIDDPITATSEDLEEAINTKLNEGTSISISPFKDEMSLIDQITPERALAMKGSPLLAEKVNEMQGILDPTEFEIWNNKLNSKLSVAPQQFKEQEMAKEAYTPELPVTSQERFDTKSRIERDTKLQEAADAILRRPLKDILVDTPISPEALDTFDSLVTLKSQQRKIFEGMQQVEDETNNVAVATKKVKATKNLKERKIASEELSKAVVILEEKKATVAEETRTVEQIQDEWESKGTEDKKIAEELYEEERVSKEDKITKEVAEKLKVDQEVTTFEDKAPTTYSAEDLGGGYVAPTTIETEIATGEKLVDIEAVKEAEEIAELPTRDTEGLDLTLDIDTVTTKQTTGKEKKTTEKIPYMKWDTQADTGGKTGQGVDGNIYVAKVDEKIVDGKAVRDTITITSINEEGTIVSTKVLPNSKNVWNKVDVYVDKEISASTEGKALRKSTIDTRAATKKVAKKAKEAKGTVRSTIRRRKGKAPVLTTEKVMDLGPEKQVRSTGVWNREVKGVSQSIYKDGKQWKSKDTNDILGKTRSEAWDNLIEGTAVVPEKAERKAKGGTKVIKLNARNVINNALKRDQRKEDYFILHHIANKLDTKLIDELDMEYNETIGFRGDYNPDTHKIRLNAEHTDKTILHELIHAVTSRQMYLNPKYAKQIDKLYKEFLAARTETGYAYGIKNTHEFLAEALSNPTFQQELMDIPSKTQPSKSLFDKFKSWVVNMFSSKPGERTMLHDAIDAVLTDHQGMIEKKGTDKFAIVKEQKGRVNLERSEWVETLPEEVVKETQAQRDTRLISEAKTAESPKERVARAWDATTKVISKYLQTTSSILNNISPQLGNLIAEFERKVNRGTRDRLQEVNKFVTGMKDFKKSNFDDYVRLDFAMKNGDTDTINDILATNEKLRKEYDTQRETTRKMGEEAIKWGLIDKLDDDYMHRMVIDLKGLSAHLEKIKKSKGKDINEYQAIVKELKKSGIKDPTLEDVTHVYADMMKTGNWPRYLQKPSAAKLRSIKELTVGMNKFYGTSEDALVSNIVEMTDAIEARRVLGISPIRQWTKDVDTLNKEISTTTGVEKDALMNNRDAMVTQIKDSEGEMRNSIANMLAGNSVYSSLTQEQVDLAVNTIKARMQQKFMSKGMGTLRDLGLISALGNPYSTITQIGDLPHIIKKRGWSNTMKALLAEKMFTGKDFDFSGYVRETQSGTATARILDKILKLTGFQKIDQFFKATTMQAAIEEAKGLSEAQFIDKYGDTHGDKTAEIYADIQSNTKSDATAQFVWRELSRTQPISPSEMPVGYLLGGNTRMFYMLKSYNIKALNTIRDDFLESKAKGGTVKASMNTMYYMALLTAAGAGADEIKDLLAGKDHGTLSDTVLDNIGKIFFFGRYSQIKFGQTGPKGYIQDLLMPAMGWIDRPTKDAYALLTGDEFKYETLKEVPIAGKFLWDHSGAGKRKELWLQRQDINKLMEKGTDDGDYGDAQKLIREYNMNGRELGVKPVNYMRSRKYYQDKATEDK